MSIDLTQAPLRFQVGGSSLAISSTLSTGEGVYRVQ